jgi:hypothetical protein
MGWTAGALPVVWAQAAGVTSATASAVGDPSAMAKLAFRRWCASLTLSSPESVPSLFGVWVWLAGLGGLLVLAVGFQGPGRALRQVVDVAGHARLAAAATRRLRRAGRMVAATIGLTVLSWTGSQSFAYNRPEGRDDLILLTRARHPAELAVEQGVLAGLTPLRDVAGLGSNLPLLVVATVLLLRATADAWGTAAPPPWVRGGRPRSTGWTHAGWACGALMSLYRLISLGAGMTELPLGGCLMVEALVVPALTAVCDGLLLGWLLAELRNAGFDNPAAGDPFDTRAAVDLMPGSVVACLAALPARYLATAVWLGLIYLPTSAESTAVGGYVRWQLSYGLAVVQGAALLVAGMAGAVAWSDGGAGEAARGYGRLLAAEGGRLAAVFGLAGLAAGAVAAVAYLALLSLPAAPWVLNAADSYAHYGTLPVGLWALSALVELGERALPEATPAAP